jgi:hypothetical protein
MESTSANRELLQSELEALSMTLNDKELKVVGSSDGDTSIPTVLVLTRRPSKEEWKDKIITEIEITVLPKNLEGDGEGGLSLQLSNQKKEVMYKAQQIPLVRLRIGLDNGYPCTSAPRVAVLSQFYKRYEEKILEALVSKWSAESMVLYEWYNYCEIDLFNEIF